MIKQCKLGVLEFLRDLTTPIGPSVFAGYGSDIQRQLAKGPLCEDKIIKEWLKANDQVILLKLLIDIAKTPELEGPFNSHRSRFREDWESLLSELIYNICAINEQLFYKVINEISSSKEAKNIIRNLNLWWCKKY